VPFLDLTGQYASIKDDVEEALQRVIEAQRFILGPEVELFEVEMAEYLGCAHAVGVASGTDALLLPLKTIDAAPGAEVIVPSFTFFATAGAVWNAGFRPVFCDVDPGTFNVTGATLEAVWTDRTVAVVPVHLFGQMAPMSEIMDLARARGAFVLEDAAQAVGARSTDGVAGGIGDAGVLSFFPTKNLGGFGDGGMVTTNDGGLADQLAKLRIHGGRKMYHHEMVGLNSRLDALQAAVLRVKLGHLDAWTEGRRANASCYDEFLMDIPEVVTPYVGDGNHHVYNQYTLRVDRRDELRDYLNTNGVGNGVYYPVPLHLQACFASLGGREGDLPVTETLCREVLSLPVFPELGESRVARVSDVIRTFFR